MSKFFNVESGQNVEVSKKIPCEKPLITQLEIMEDYTATHKKFGATQKYEREIACLKVLYPALFRKIDEQDMIAGRTDFLPIGFGCVTSLGGVGHYCIFQKLTAFKNQFQEKEIHERVNKLYEYWLNNDLKTKYGSKVLTENTIGGFIDCKYPLIATARLSGMMLNYHMLLDNGIEGLRKKIEKKQLIEPDNTFYKESIEALYLFETCAKYLAEMAGEEKKKASPKREKELQRIEDSLLHIQKQKPTTFHQALQLFWLYALLAGVINYGRLDDLLGHYLVSDLKNGILTEDEAYNMLHSLWTMIENRRTTVNGRIIVGGRGRRHPEEADVLARLAMKVAKNCRYVEPQFTLRITKDMPEDLFDDALDTLGGGATYPTLYNDDINIPSVMYGMRIDEETAEQYVPFGCTEFVIQGQSTGTPNTCINLLKLLTIMLNKGVDPFDGVYRGGDIPFKALNDYQSFDEFYHYYKELLDYYLDLAVKAQYESYGIMNQEVGFIFTSILMDDCIERGKALLDGGVKYLGGTCETYGNINTSDTLYAIKHLVFEKKQFDLETLHQAALNNFKDTPHIRKALISCDKYGNDLTDVDEMAIDFYEFVAKGVRQRGIEIGMDYFLMVISNNQLNTEWGRTTAASLDGRLRGMYMNPANNPQGGADKNGPTAMLNSLVKLDPKYHAGSVQNIKFTPRLFNDEREKIKFLFKTYFKKGGCHLMVTVVDRGVLEDARMHPEKYPRLIVRVSGFSAVFVDLDGDIQEELLSRVLYD